MSLAGELAHSSDPLRLILKELLPLSFEAVLVAQARWATPCSGGGQGSAACLGRWALAS